MEEMVLTVPAKLLKEKFGSSSDRLLVADETGFIEFVNGHREYVPRSLAESDDTKKQIIAYLLIRCGDKTFMTRRLKAQSEKRLHDRRSVGVGGHINDGDGEKTAVKDGMERELHEEVFIGCDYSCKFLGIINDDSTEVGKVHAGLCYEISLSSPDCKVRETEKMEGVWADEKTLRNSYESMENWSKIVLNTVFGF